MNHFADALHQHNKTLSVDIAGCCGWVDTARPKAPVGHCAGAFATHEFVSTSCPMYANSSVDTVYGMSSYSGDQSIHHMPLTHLTLVSGAINGPLTPLPPYNYTYGPPALMEIANATAVAIGHKYGTGFKGGWPWCANYTEPNTCVFDEAAKQNVRVLRDELGVSFTSLSADDGLELVWVS